MPSPVSTTISEIRSSTADVPSELYTTDGDQAGSWMCDPSDGTVNVSWFGAIGDGIADDRDSIQRAIDAISEGGTLVLNSSKGFYIGDSLYVNKSIKIQFQGSLITHVFNKPHIVIDQTNDVILAGEPAFLYVGPRQI
jgi:polygalacturonase